MNTVKVRNLELGSGIPAICIPNVGKTREEILTLAGQYKDMHMDLMEWRMDWYEDVEDTDKVLDVLSNLRSLLKDMPLLATFRTVKEGGVHGMSREKYIALNKAVAASGHADLIDVEIFAGDKDVRDMIASIHACGAKVIGSNHDFDKTPAKSDIVFRLRKMQDMELTFQRLPLCQRAARMSSLCLPPRKRWLPVTLTGPSSPCLCLGLAASAASPARYSAPV